MIDPKYLINVDDPVLRLYEGLQADILTDIVRRIEKADYGITETAKWQIYKLQESGMLYAGILNNVAKLSGKSEAEVKKIFEDAAIENLTDIKPDIDDPYQLINANKSVLDRLLAGIERTNGELYNLTLSTAESAQSAFFNAADRAYMQISSGAFDYNTAVYNAVKTVTDSGVPYVTYPSGWKNRIDVAVRRAVMTGVVSTANAVSLNLTKELGLDYVDISAHAGARPSHAVWQGKRYCVSGKDKRFPPLSETGYGSGDGLGGWNCRHSMHPTTADAPPYYSEEELNRINSESVCYNGEKMSLYDATQEQRKMESSMRDTRVKLSAYGSMKDNPAAQSEFASLSVKLKEQEAEYRNFCRQTGLAEQNERLRVVGFNRSLSQKAVWANKKVYNSFRKAYSLNGEGLPKTVAKYTNLKYNDVAEFNRIKKYVAAVEKGEISPLAGYAVYKQTALEVEQKLIGIKTVTGVTITDYSSHMICRIIGNAGLTEKTNRLGVSVDKVLAALQNGIVKKTDHSSTNLVYKDCQVSFNHETGLLIQVNPRKIMKKDWC